MTHSTKHFYIFWISLQIKRTSFGSGEDVLEEMFATWEPFLSKAMELLGIESLAKVCAIHAAVEKVNYCLVLNQYFQKVNIRKIINNNLMNYWVILKESYLGSKTSSTNHFATTYQESYKWTQWSTNGSAPFKWNGGSITWKSWWHIRCSTKGSKSFEIWKES